LSKGAENANRILGDLERELKIKISSSTAAQLSAAKTLGSKKAVVAHPYAQADTRRLGSYAEEFGCELLGATGWGSAFNQIGRIPKNAALVMARSLMRDHPGADTILFPSPHWPTAFAIDEIEHEFRVNVVAAHQAIVWHALRRCGIGDPIVGFGRLLREF
jgi:maleate isomerase